MKWRAVKRHLHLAFTTTRKYFTPHEHTTQQQFA